MGQIIKTVIKISALTKIKLNDIIYINGVMGEFLLQMIMTWILIIDVNK